MAHKLGFFDQWFGGEWADRAAINRNADDLSAVEASVSGLQAVVQRQGQEILRLRAMFLGVVDVLHQKAPFDDAELERAVQIAWTKLTTPPPTTQGSTDPYRRTPAVPERLVTCVRCARQVPASRTNITEGGEVCDACG
jgi:hypothetical protein